jgi:AcrR family transcriptional regulator
VTTLAQSAQAKKLFLEAFAGPHPTVSHAAKAAGIGRRTVYDWLERDAEFREAFKSAEQEAFDTLEREAVRRAAEGVEEPVYAGGKQVGSIRKYSDTLLIFLLKGARPSKYRERIDVTIQAREKAQKVADELGVSVDEVMAEAERIAAEASKR